MDSSHSVQSVVRALSVLKCFTAHKTEWSLMELSSQVQLNKSTVFRMVHTLKTQGFLSVRPNGKYVLGAEMYHFAAWLTEQNRLKCEALPFMQHLMRSCGESVVLVQYENYRAVCLEHVESNHMVKIASSVGQYVHPFLGATGRIITSFLDEKELQEVIAVQADSFHIQPPDDMEQWRMQGRKDGYLISIGELDKGVYAISAPLFNHSAAVMGSLSIIGPEFRLSDSDPQKNIAALLHTAHEISTLFGYKHKTLSTY